MNKLHIVAPVFIPEKVKQIIKEERLEVQAENSKSIIVKDRLGMLKEKTESEEKIENNHVYDANIEEYLEELQNILTAVNYVLEYTLRKNYKDLHVSFNISSHKYTCVNFNVHQVYKSDNKVGWYTEIKTIHKSMYIKNLDDINVLKDIIMCLDLNTYGVKLDESERIQDMIKNMIKF